MPKSISNGIDGFMVVGIVSFALDLLALAWFFA